MSPQPPSHSPDIQRLIEEGYGVQTRGAQLIVSTPYVNSDRQVRWGRLVSALELSGNTASRPDIHVVWFIGEKPGDMPCDSSGARLDRLIHQASETNLGDGLVASCGFSRRPANALNDYADYHEKMSTYVGMLVSEVHEIDQNVSFRDHPPIPTVDEASVFRYEDSATTRARIGAVVDRIRDQRIAIVGLGGSGSYILDAVAKTPVAEIHLFDDDELLTHNAFRAPGAPTLEELEARPLKVVHHQKTYDAMHKKVIANPVRVSADNVSDLDGFDFVFLSVDASPDKRIIMEKLQASGIPFADTGMGIYQHDSSIAGIVRTSVSTPRQAHPAWMTESGEVSFVDVDDDDYAQNIQIAELNMLNASLAVIAWKKHFGFYVDLEHERSSNYTIDGNHLHNIGGVSDESD